MSATASYAMRRVDGGTTTGFYRNYNSVRHESARKLGPVSFTVVVALLVLVVGLLYITQGAKATSYDYELEKVDRDIAALQAARDDLAVENARLTAVAASDRNEVAANMPSAIIAGYVAE